MFHVYVRMYVWYVKLYVFCIAIATGLSEFPSFQAPVGVAVVVEMVDQLVQVVPCGDVGVATMVVASCPKHLSKRNIQ